ncbi:MAG: hypothetical protein HY913_13470 [Desulfomonile tiedjei]|nr:hypothetical protein [Desulfomonile tiedjei]
MATFLDWERDLDALDCKTPMERFLESANQTPARDGLEALSGSGRKWLRRQDFRLDLKNE